MEGEAQVVTAEPSTTAEVSVEAVQAETAQEQTQSSTENKPSGFDKVEFTPEQQARIDRLYGNMKRYEGDAREQRRLNQELAGELTRIRQEQQQIVSHIQVNDFNDAETRLRAERDQAWTKGDVNLFNAANDKLSEIRVQKVLAEREAKAKPQQAQQQQPRNINGAQIVNGALDHNAINNTDAAIINSWMAESDGAKRPWVNANDPRNFEASKVAEAVLNSPLFSDKPIGEKLKEIDRRMGIQSVQQGQNVLSGGNLTRGGKTNNIKLSPEIEKLAIRTKFGGSKAKTDQDHVEAWKQAVIKSQKGARK